MLPPSYKWLNVGNVPCQEKSDCNSCDYVGFSKYFYTLAHQNITITIDYISPVNYNKIEISCFWAILFELTTLF